MSVEEVGRSVEGVDDPEGPAIPARELILDLLDRYGEDRPFPEDGFYEVIEEMTYPEIGDFFDRHVAGAEPLPIDARNGVPVHEGRLTLLEGPERLETGWWDEHGIARDYYTAVNPGGIRLWIFRDRLRRQHADDRSGWYLHGIFG